MFKVQQGTGHPAHALRQANPRFVTELNKKFRFIFARLWQYPF